MSKPRQLRVQDLPSLTGTDERRPMLFCERCGGEFSAERGDYFMARPEAPLRCCGRSLRLVHKETVYREAV